MGAISSSVMCGRKPIPVNLIGYSGSGKTTILYKYQLGSESPVNTIHTIGYNFEVIKYKSHSFEVMDFGGGDKIQPLWRNHFKGKPIMIFVVDSADRNEIECAKDTLNQWLDCHDKDSLLLLVFANKQDTPNPMTVTEIIDQFNLNTLKYPWHVQPCIAITGEGICEGLEWLYKNLP